MNPNRQLTIGVCRENFNGEAIQRLLKGLNIPYSAYIVKDIEHDNVGLFDTLLFINPKLNDRQIQALEKFVKNGTSVALLISGEKWLYEGSLSLLKFLGVNIQKTHRTKKLNLRYSQDYPITFRRGNKDVLTSPQKAAYAMFTLDKKTGPKSKTSLIAASTLLADYSFAAKLEFGRGILLVINSRSFSEDRSELIEYLMRQASERKTTNFTTVIEKIRENLIDIIEDAFDVYDEVPLGLVAQRAGVDRPILEQFDFLLEIETLIRRREIYAKIQGNYIVRA